MRTRIVVGFPPAGPVDIAARFIAPLLARGLGQEFAVDNIAGESGNTASALVAIAPPDGHTLLLSAVVNTINTTLYQGLPFDFETDFAAVAGLYRVPLIVEVHPGSRARTVSDLIDLARRNPGGLRAGYAGKGTPQHLAIEKFKSMADVEFTMVPYLGSSPVLEDLLQGRVDVMFDPAPSSIERVRSGQLRALAFTGSTPLATLPDVPLLSNTLPGCQAWSWFGISAPRQTPRARIDALNAAANAALDQPESKQVMTRMGAEPMPGSPEDYANFIREETARHARTIAAGNLALIQAGPGGR